MTDLEQKALVDQFKKIAEKALITVLEEFIDAYKFQLSADLAYDMIYRGDKNE